MLSRKSLHDLHSLTRPKWAMSNLGKDIFAAREAKGWTQTDLANKLGVTRNAVSLWEAGTNRPAHHRILKMISLFGVDRLGDVTKKIQADTFEISGDGLPVDGLVAASTWQERDELGQVPTEFIPMGNDPSYPGRRQYAVRVMGNSMNNLVQDGEYAVVVEAFGQAPRDGDVVVVTREKGGLVERSLKVFKAARDGSKAQLVPDSTDDKYKPLPVDGEVEIEAFVIGYYRRAVRR